MKEQTAANPKFREEFQENMTAFRKDFADLKSEVEKREEGLNAVHKKHGIDVELNGSKSVEKGAAAEGKKQGKP